MGENAKGAAVRWRAVSGQWLGSESGRCYLIALVDEATGCAQARFARINSVEENLRVLWQYVGQWGCPRSVHTNCKTLFRGNPLSSDARTLGRGNSRIQEVLRALDVEWIGEETQSTPKILRKFFEVAVGLEGEFKTIDAANRHLQKKHLLQWNRDFAVDVARDEHRSVPADLESVFSEVTIRVLQPGGVLHYRGKHYAPECDVALSSGTAIRIEERLDGSTQASADGMPVRLGAGSFATTAPKAPVIEKKKLDRRHNGRPKNREWMANFLNRPQRPLWMVLRPNPGGDRD